MLDVGRRCQSSCCRGGHPFQDHQCLSGRQRCATSDTLAKAIRVKVVVTYANNALRSNKLDQLVCYRALAITLTIGLEVAKVTNMALLVGGSTVVLVEGVDCPNPSLLACKNVLWPERARMTPEVSECGVVRRKRTMWTGGSAAVSIVTEGMYVNATLSVGVVSGNIP